MASSSSSCGAVCSGYKTAPLLLERINQSIDNDCVELCSEVNFVAVLPLFGIF